MRNFFFILFLSFTSLVFASKGERRIVSDTIHLQLTAIKDLLISAEWQPVDSVAYSRMWELVDFIENSPVDSVLNGLRQQTDSTSMFFTRELRKIRSVDGVNGYIDAVQINKVLIQIEQEVVDELPLTSIVVPEDKFVGMYTKLPLITYANIDRLIADSIVSYPDSIASMLQEVQHSRNPKKIKQVDSLVNGFLNNARKIYNDSLITRFRDSISYQYRVDYQKSFVDSLKKVYTDSIARINYKALKYYNDSITIDVNQTFKNELQSLINYVNRMPNQLMVYDLYNDVFELPLQNDGVWYKWIYLKNAQNDSIGIRIENLDKHSMRLLVDETVNLSRLTQRETMQVDRIQPIHVFEQRLDKVKLRQPKISPWRFEGKAYSGFTQTFINQFWSKGGNTSGNMLSTFSYDANYSKGKLKWENGIDAKLGWIYYMDGDTTAVTNLHKNSDNLEINSRLGYSAFKEWYYSAEANFKTQFSRGFKNNKTPRDEPNSGLLSPAYLTFSGGFDYKPNKNFSAFLSPLSVKTTIVTNPLVDETKFGLDEGQTRKSRIGMTGRLNFSKDVMENVSLKTKNNLFVNFGSKDGEWQFIKMPDFDSETSVDFKVNRFINTQLNFHFIYDKELESKWTDKNNVEQTGVRWQVKEFFTLGISYKF